MKDPSTASRRHRWPDCSVPLQRRIVGGSCAHLDSLWLRFLPAVISSLLQASELACQLGDLDSGVVDGLHGAAVRELDGRDVSGDLP